MSSVTPKERKRKVLFGLQILNALTWKVHFWYACTSVEDKDQVCLSRSSDQDHFSKKDCLCFLLAVCLPSVGLVSRLFPVLSSIKFRDRAGVWCVIEDLALFIYSVQPD